MSTKSLAFLAVCVATIAIGNAAIFNGNGANAGAHVTKAEQPILSPVFNGICEEKNGRYSVADQCDAYVECTRGEPEEKLCPDGLMFNDKLKPTAYPCEYPIDVDCGSRTKVQPAEVGFHSERSLRKVY